MAGSSDDTAVEDLTDVIDVQHELQELTGIDSSVVSDDESETDTSGVLDSYPSVPAFRVNVPEVKEVKARFIYNFFTPNERETIENAEQILDVSVSRDDEIFFQLNNDRKPRYVTIEFKPPKRTNPIGVLRNSSLLTSYFDKIIVEGGVSNEDFFSFEIVDSGKEKSLYSMLNGSSFVTISNSEENSPQDNYKKLLEANSDGSLTGEEKKLIASALQGMQSKGYRLARTDISDESAENADDLVSRQNFTIQANKLVFDQVVDSALRIPDTLFQDEFDAIKNYARESRDQAIVRNNSNRNSESVYTSVVPVISSHPITSNFTDIQNMEKLSQQYQDYPVIKHAGYVIKKIEVLENDTHVDRGFLISDNPDGLYILDENVRYGGIYLYEIRSIYYVKMIAEERNEDDPALDDVSEIELLIASEGKVADVRCTENIPPDPPTNVKINFDYKARKPRINWQFPVNPQRDVKRFQIFKRSNVESPFTLIAEYDFDNSTIRSSVTEIGLEDRVYRISNPKISYVDNEWNEGETPIYTVACVDAHGFTSNYGTQMRFVYNRRLNKVSNIMISYPNAPKPYPNLLLNRDSFDDAIKVSGYDRMRIYLDPEYYKVTKYVNRRPNTEQDLDFLRVDPGKDTYKIHMLNIDNHKDKILNIRIADFSGDPTLGTTSTG